MSDLEDESPCVPDANTEASQTFVEDSRVVQGSVQTYDEFTTRLSRGQSEQASLSCCELLDVDRSALEAILDVSCRLQGIQRRSRVSMSTLSQTHETYKDKQVN